MKFFNFRAAAPDKPAPAAAPTDPPPADSAPMEEEGEDADADPAYEALMGKMDSIEGKLDALIASMSAPAEAAAPAESDKETVARAIAAGIAALSVPPVAADRSSATG